MGIRLKLQVPKPLVASPIQPQTAPHATERTRSIYHRGAGPTGTPPDTPHPPDTAMETVGCNILFRPPRPLSAAVDCHLGRPPPKARVLSHTTDTDRDAARQADHRARPTSSPRAPLSVAGPTEFDRYQGGTCNSNRPIKSSRLRRMSPCPLGPACSPGPR